MNDWVRYRLLDDAGSDLGVLMSPTSTWTVGDVVHRGPASYTVVRVVDAEDADDVAEYLVVAPAPR